MISSRPVRSAIVGFGKDSGADADGGAGAAMLHIDDDASSEASEDGRVEAYRDKFGGKQVNLHSKQFHRRRRNRLTAQCWWHGRATRRRGVVKQGTRSDSLCVQQGAVASSAWTAEADGLADEVMAADALDTDDGDSSLSEDSSGGGSESGDSSGGSSSSADEAEEADGEDAAAEGKGADAALRGENSRGKQGGGAGSAKSKRSVRRYFQDEDSSVQPRVQCRLAAAVLCLLGCGAGFQGKVLSAKCPACRACLSSCVCVCLPATGNVQALRWHRPLRPRLRQ